MNNFDLNNTCPQIGENEEDDGYSLFSPNLIHQFNRQYSIIFKEIQKFLEECKNSIQRFVTLHSFGVNFNLSRMLGTLAQVEQTFNQSLQQNEPEKSTSPKIKAKHNYEFTFNRLVYRMGGFLTEILQCEREFKKQYFLGKAHKEKPIPVKKQTPHINRANSMKISSFQQTHELNLLEEEERDKARQAQIREALNERLQLRLNKVQDKCSRQFSTTQNLYRLNDRIDDVISHMRANRERQSKLIELFNLNRIKRLPLAQTQPTPTPSTDISMNSDQEQIDQFLDNCRTIHKAGDTHTERSRGGQQPNFKKVNMISAIKR